VRPAGFYTTKPKRLVEFCRFIKENYSCWKNFCGENLKTAREKLLTLYGIGPETADTILLYAAEKPTFVVDEYTRRLVRVRNLAEKFDYDSLKNLFEKNLPPDPKLFQDFHALIIFEVKQGKNSRMGLI
jgi:endonuclease-3 related protein